MTYPPPGGSQDPTQPQQPYAPPVDPTRPFPSEPTAGGSVPGLATPIGSTPGAWVPGGFAPGAPGAPGTPGGYGSGGHGPGGYGPGGYGPGGEPAYGQPPYGAPAPYGTPMYAPVPTTNTMAILSLVFAFVFPVAGIVMGHVAKRQIRESGEQGEGLATAGLWLGYIFTALGVLVCIGYVLLIAFAIGNGATQSDGF
jgi:hypothetical protein